MTNAIVVLFGRKGSGKTYLANNMVRSLDRLVILDSLCEYTEGVVIEELESFIDYLRRNLRGKFRVILRLTEDEDITLAFRALWAGFDYTLVIEEADYYCNPANIDEGFMRLIKYGRHRRINLIAISRRPAEVSRHVTAQADTIISFKQSENRDVDYLVQRLGKEANCVRDLGLYEYRIFGDTDIPVEVFGLQRIETNKQIKEEKEE